MNSRCKEDQRRDLASKRLLLVLDVYQLEYGDHGIHLRVTLFNIDQSHVVNRKSQTHDALDYKSRSQWTSGEPEKRIHGTWKQHSSLIYSE